MRRIWRRSLSVQAEPPPALILVTALLALSLVGSRRLWPYTRLLITISHEGGHAFAALLTGRRLQGIRLHTDTSGLTVSSGRPRGLGMVIMLMAGYLAPAVVGLGAVLLLINGHALGLLWLLVVILAAMVLKIRNLYGFAAIAGCAAALLAISWYATAPEQSALAYLITWTLLIAAPKPILELLGERRRRSTPQSDVDQLARLTGVPGTLWLVGFGLLSLAGLVLGAILLAPAVLELWS